MKDGRVPIHIQRWCSADYHGDEHVKLLKARRDWATLTFYRHFIDFSFAAGGDLPADAEALAAAVEMPLSIVRKALAFCSGRLIEERDGRLYQKRVVRDIGSELDFRAEQAERGRLGGRPKKAMAFGNEKPTITHTPESPPAPTPAPAPNALRQAPAPTPDAVPERPGNPLIAGRRVEMERESLRMVEEISALSDEDPVEVMARASGFPGSQRTKLNPATMSDDRLANTWRDLKTDLTALRQRKNSQARA